MEVANLEWVGDNVLHLHIAEHEINEATTLVISDKNKFVYEASLVMQFDPTFIKEEEANA